MFNTLPRAYQLNTTTTCVLRSVLFEPWHGISKNVVCATSKASDQPARTRSLIRALAFSLDYSMNIKLLTGYNLEFLSLIGGCTGSSESTHVKMPHCWKSHVTAHSIILKVLVITVKVHLR